VRPNLEGEVDPVSLEGENVLSSLALAGLLTGDVTSLKPLLLLRGEAVSLNPLLDLRGEEKSLNPVLLEGDPASLKPLLLRRGEVYLEGDGDLFSEYKLLEGDRVDLSDESPARILPTNSL